MSFKWDDKTVLILIKKIHDIEALWNREHPDYKDRMKRATGMRTIARSLGTVRDEVERKLKNLTSHYYREKKIYERRIAAVGSGAVAPRWFAYKAMNFLQDKHVPRRKRPPADGGDDQPRVNKGSATLRHIAENTCESIKNPPPVSRDEAAVFGEYVAFKIRRMDPVTTATVQHHIHNIIYRAEMTACYGAGRTAGGGNFSAVKIIENCENGHDNGDLPFYFSCKYSPPEADNSNIQTLIG